MNLRIALFTFLVCEGAAAQTTPLPLMDVLDSTLKNYPPLLAAIQDRVIADADITTAEGRFDVNSRSRWYGNYFGPYENQNFDLGMDQATQFQGMSYFAGYMLGQGRLCTLRWQEPDQHRRRVARRR